MSQAQRKSPVSADYHKLSIQQKQAHALSAARELSVSCPCCDMQVTPSDLLKHMDERCAGLREPNGASKWVTWGEALALGVASGTFHRWVEQGRVRRRGECTDRKYLLRDLVLLIAVRKLRQRRELHYRSFEDQESESMK